MREAVGNISIPGVDIRRGKVRDIVDLEHQLALVATDRISAFDVVMPDLVPGKGELLRKISHFWFSFFRDIPNHLTQQPPPSVMIGASGKWKNLAIQMERTTFCKKLKMIPIEFVVRGYLSGSAWKSYKRDGAICDITLPPRLRESEQLSEPIFTPSTKAEEGHDENIGFDQAVEICARWLGWRWHAAKQLILMLADRSIDIYRRANSYAIGRGFIIADTKFEFGIDAVGTVRIADELLTPDSSRYWELSAYDINQSQDSYDKQILRDYLETLDWDKEPPGPSLPIEIVEKIYDRYDSLVKRLI